MIKEIRIIRLHHAKFLRLMNFHLGRITSCNSFCICFGSCTQLKYQQASDPFLKWTFSPDAFVTSLKYQFFSEVCLCFLVENIEDKAAHTVGYALKDITREHSLYWGFFTLGIHFMKQEKEHGSSLQAVKNHPLDLTMKWIKKKWKKLSSRFGHFFSLNQSICKHHLHWKTLLLVQVANKRINKHCCTKYPAVISQV